MVCSKQRIVNGLLALSCICILHGCAFRHPPLQSEPEAPPAQVEIKHENTIATPATPVLEIPTPETSKPRFYLHKVCWPNESLSLIAKWYTGSVNNWKAIAKSNPTLNPNQIFIGDTISIPEDLLTSRKPMPLSFVPSAVRKKSAPPSSSNQNATQPESPELFGPVEPEQTATKSIHVELFSPIE